MKLNIGIGDDMKNIDDFIKQISFEILSKDLKSKDVSLLKGKMGLVILFYELNSVYQQKDYELFAESLFEDILEIGNNIHFPIRFDGGLLDYGLGLEYLMGRGFLIIDNDAKNKLQKIWGIVSQSLIHCPPIELNIQNGILGFGFYFLYCIRNGAFGEENLRTLHCKQLLAVDVLDCIERLLNKNIKSLNEKKKTYDLMWNLPCLLYFLYELYKLDIYNVKVKKLISFIIKNLGTSIELPQEQWNVLYLLTVLNKINNVMNIDDICNKISMVYDYDKLVRNCLSICSISKNVEILFLLVLLNDKKYKQEVEELFLILGTQYDNEPFGNKCVLLDGIGGLVVSMLIYRMFRKNSS